MQKKFKSLLLLANLCLLAGAQTSAPLPALSISTGTNQVRIEFSGTLQAAPSVTGPWIDLTNATPLIQSSLQGSQFFRARATLAPGSIFSQNSVVNLTITGPLQQHFELAHAGMPDGIFPPVREKPYFDGKIELAGFTRPISLRVRGNSSLQECPFPKLKFKISKEHRAGTPFFDAREIKIGTHCAEGGRGPIGRLRDQTAAYREALAYEVMQTIGLTAPRVRRALIEYHDTTPANDMSETGWVVTRHAFILEDPEVVAERLGGRALDDEEIQDLQNANFSEQTITNLRLLHILFGNWDFALSLDGSNLWNTDVIELADKRLIPLAGDFDLSSFVTERVRLNAPWDFHPELPDLDREMRYQLTTLRSEASAATFAAGVSQYQEKRAALDQLIATALLDESGRTNAQQHITAFYTALQALAEPPKPKPKPGFEGGGRKGEVICRHAVDL